MFRIIFDIIKTSLIDGVISAGKRIAADMVRDLKKEGDI
jgi:hypothetical protein